MIITHRVMGDPEEPGSIALAVGSGKYIFRTIENVFQNVSFCTDMNSYRLMGRRVDVMVAARMIEYFLESPRKRLGTLFLIPPHEISRIGEIRNRLGQITCFGKSKMIEATDMQTDKTYVLCPGLPKYENHYNANTYLNNIFYNRFKESVRSTSDRWRPFDEIAAKKEVCTETTEDQENKVM